VALDLAGDGSKHVDRSEELSFLLDGFGDADGDVDGFQSRDGGC